MRPRAFAVLRLITSSNFVGCSTGRSAGLGAFEDLVDVGGGPPELVMEVGSIGHEAAGAYDELPLSIDCR